MSPEYCFVLEDAEGVFGYGLAALDCKQFAQQCQIAWSPALCEKYPKPVKETLTAADVSGAVQLWVSLAVNLLVEMEKAQEYHP